MNMRLDPVVRSLLAACLFALPLAPCACSQKDPGSQDGAGPTTGKKKAPPVFDVPTWGQSPEQISRRYAKADGLKLLKAQADYMKRTPGTAFLRFLLLVDGHNCPVTFRFRDGKLVQAIVDFRPACARHGAQKVSQEMESLLHKRYGAPTAVHEGRMRLAWQTEDSEISINYLADPRTKGPGKAFVLWYVSRAELAAETHRSAAGPTAVGAEKH